GAASRAALVGVDDVVVLELAPGDLAEGGGVVAGAAVQVVDGRRALGPYPLDVEARGPRPSVGCLAGGVEGDVDAQRLVPVARRPAVAERSRAASAAGHGASQPNSAAAFASRVLSSASAGTPLASASTAAVSRTLAGVLGLPRCGTGERKGLSVSTRSLSAGTAAAASRSALAEG